MPLQKQISHNGWMWQQFIPGETVPAASGGQEANWQFKAWVARCQDLKADYTDLRTVGEDKALYGSLYYFLNPVPPETEELNKVFFHYYLTPEALITSSIDVRPFKRSNEEDLQFRLKECGSAADVLFLLIGEILNTFIDGMDHFEVSMRIQERENKKDHTGGQVLEEIINLRYLLIQWISVTIPIQDVLLAAQEVFLDELDEHPEYKRTKLRLDRLLTLEIFYEKEIDSLLLIDDNITNYRGNEVIRSLTLLTVIFVPVTALGSVLGMNFKYMPLVEWHWGFFVAISAIFICMICAYLYFRKKGWTRDLLKGPPKKAKK